MNNQNLLDCSIEIANLFKCDIDIPCYTLKELSVAEKCLAYLNNKNKTESNENIYDIQNKIHAIYKKYKELPSSLITEYILCGTQLSTHLWNTNYNEVINTLYDINLTDSLKYKDKKHPSIQELWGVRINNPTSLFINSLIRSNDLELAKKIYKDFNINHAQVLFIIETLFFKIHMDSDKPTTFINETMQNLQQIIHDKKVSEELNQILIKILNSPTLSKESKILNHYKERIILWMANNPSNLILGKLDNKCKKEITILLAGNLFTITKSNYNPSDTNKALLFKNLVFSSNDWINSACLQNTYTKAIKKLIQCFKIPLPIQESLFNSKEFLADYEKNKMKHDLISPQTIHIINKTEEKIYPVRKNKI